MEKIELSDFIFKSNMDNTFSVFNTNTQQKIPLGNFSNPDYATNAKRRFFSEKITITPDESGLFNILFDGKEINGLENPCKISDIEKIIHPHGLKIENNICVFRNEI